MRELELSPEERMVVESYATGRKPDIDPEVLKRVQKKVTFKLGTEGKHNKAQATFIAASRGQIDPSSLVREEVLRKVAELSSLQMQILETMTADEGEHCDPKQIQRLLNRTLNFTIGVELKKINEALGIEIAKSEEMQIQAGVAYLAYKKNF